MAEATRDVAIGLVNACPLALSVQIGAQWLKDEAAQLIALRLVARALHGGVIAAVLLGKDDALIRREVGAQCLLLGLVVPALTLNPHDAIQHVEPLG